MKAETKPPSKVTKAKGSDTAESTANGSTADSPEKWYWLMKAEPESRFENGTDVRFSIDDLASRTEPEPWDGRSFISHSLAPLEARNSRCMISIEFFIPAGHLQVNWLCICY